jgi:hypothetical protein
MGAQAVQRHHVPSCGRGRSSARIVHGEAATANIGFGGNDWRTLFFTTRNTLGSVNVKIPGIPVPVPKKA